MNDKTTHPEHFISVDIEAAGPNPSKYAMLSIGACTIPEPRETFYVELQPDKNAITDEALEVSNLPLEYLNKEGLPPRIAMKNFADWVMSVTPIQDQPVFTAFNAPFDWMFVNEYFHRYLGYNPFGHKALDIKALYMGLKGSRWSDTSYYQVIKDCCVDEPLTHHALEDAIQQAKIFQTLMNEIGGK